MDQIAQNFRRSSSGVSVSSASWRTRSLKSSHESSRLKYSAVSSRSASVRAGGEVGHAADATPRASGQADAFAQAAAPDLERAPELRGRLVEHDQPGRAAAARARGRGRGRARPPPTARPPAPRAPRCDRLAVDHRADQPAQSRSRCRRPRCRGRRAGRRAPSNAAAACSRSASQLARRAAGRCAGRRRRACPSRRANEADQLDAAAPASRRRSRVEPPPTSTTAIVALAAALERRAWRRRRPAAPPPRRVSTSTLDARAARARRRTARRRCAAPRIAAVATTRSRSAPAASAAAALRARRRPRPRRSPRPGRLPGAPQLAAQARERPLRAHLARARRRATSATSTRVVFEPMSMQAQRIGAGSTLPS